MSSLEHLSVARSWMMRSRRSWVRWRQTKHLQRQVRRLRRLALKQQRALELRLEFLTLLEQLEHPQVVLPSGSPIPTSELMHPLLEPPPLPPLTEQEMEELRALPMPDPLEEIERALGLSTSQRLPLTSED